MYILNPSFVSFAFDGNQVPRDVQPTDSAGPWVPIPGQGGARVCLNTSNNKNLSE